ncbi:MAG: ABC transporter permease [Syntrophobacteraceae bacterium]|nr:ABC transporter permease [Syntrophobacteraceae bacterium]
MITWMKIAIRNIVKNRRRSLFTILAIAVGYAAVNVFGGFTEYIFKSLQDSFIYAQGNGHLTIFKKGFLAQGKLDPFQFMLSEAETELIRELCRKDPRVMVVTPQLMITGLISNGSVSTIFVGVGRVPSDLTFVRSRATGMIGRLKLYEGRNLVDEVPHGVGLSAGLAKKLDLHQGSEAIAMSPTIHGQINALDMQVFQVFHSPYEELDDKLLMAPLDFAQSLYDTTSADRITVLLTEDRSTLPVKEHFERIFADAGLDVELMTWKDLSIFYVKVKDMFDIIFLFIFVIVFVIVVMSVVNTVSMAIMERTQEIGTLRALGLKRRGIVKLFAIESSVLGLIGSLVGIVFTFVGWGLVKVIEPSWIPPNIPYRVPLEVHLVPGYMAVSFVFLILLSVLSAILPARKAALKGIVDALGHV